VILDPKTSRKIFELARDQQEELEMPDDQDEGDDADPVVPDLQPRMRIVDDISDASDNEGAEQMSDDGDAEDMFVSPGFHGIERGTYVNQQLDSGDIQALDTLLPANSGERRTLADVIFSKLHDSQSGNVTVIQKVQQGLSPTTPAHQLCRL
jgi:essential nuclear protein 1